MSWERRNDRTERVTLRFTEDERAQIGRAYYYGQRPPGWPSWRRYTLSDWLRAAILTAAAGAPAGVSDNSPAPRQTPTSTSDARPSDNAPSQEAVDHGRGDGRT